MRLLAIVLACAAAGCSAAPPVLPGPDPADPGTPVARIESRSSLGGYVGRRPVEPGSWREQNERVTPAPKP